MSENREFNQLESQKDVLSEDYVPEEVMEDLEPTYKSKYGNFSWQQDRMMAFGRTNAMRNYFMVQILSFVMSIASIVVLYFTTDQFHEYLGFLIFFGIIVLLITFVMLKAVYNFHYGSKSYDLRLANKGVSTYLSIYRLLYVLQITGAVLLGIAMFFLIIASMATLGAYGLVFFFVMIIAGIVVGLSLFIMSQTIKFLEGINNNLEQRTTNFNYHTPDTSILRAFAIIGIILSVVSVLGILALYSQPLYNELLSPADMITTPLSYAISIATMIISYLLLTQFDKVMAEYKQKRV